MTSLIIAPCKGCEDRKMGCHSKCEKYIEWKKATEERKKAIEKQNQGIMAAIAYEIKEKEKNMKVRRR